MAAEGKSSSGEAQISKDAALAVFREFDVDESNTIEKVELQDLAYSLGIVLDERELDEAFRVLDADDSGKIDFEEFYSWISAPRASGSGSSSALLRLKLRNRFLVRQTRRFTAAAERLATVAKPPDSGLNRFHFRATAGDVGEHPELGVYLRLEKPETDPLPELSPPEGASSALFITMPAKSTVEDIKIVEFCAQVNALYTAHLKSVFESSIPQFCGFRCEGPMTLEGVSDKIIMFKVFFKVDPLHSLITPLTGGAGSTHEVIRYAGAMLAFNKTLAQFLEGGGSASPAVVAELCVDVDRSAVKVAADALREIVRQSGASDSDSESDDEEGTEMLRVAMSLDLFRLMREMTVKWEADSLKQLLVILARRAGDSVRDHARARFFGTLRKALTNPAQFKAVVGGLLGLTDSFSDATRSLFEIFVEIVGSFDRIALLTSNSLLSVDLTGFDMSWLPEIYKEAMEE